jgi:ubiquinone/menaquinone biosynthesis C-methylase UbiE
MEKTAIHELVTSQFAPTAASYAASTVHGDAAALADVVALAEPRATDVVLDVATGAGHVALALAPHVARVVAYDMTPSMLEQTLKSAKERGFDNFETVQGIAERLPFEDGTFDLYTVRLAPHHYADIAASIREAARVLKPGGRFLAVDTTSPEDDILDGQLNEIETLRDPSHVRNYRPTEWRSMVEDAGLEVVSLTDEFCGAGRAIDFDEWVTRMRTPADTVSHLRRIFAEASPELRELLDVQFDGGKLSFRLPQVNLLAKKPL